MLYIISFGPNTNEKLSRGCMGWRRKLPIMITFGLGVSEIGHFQTVNRIFGQHFSKNTASVRAFIYQFCPKESLWDNISHLDCGFCWVMGISCSIANDNVKLVFWVKVGMDLGPLLAFSDG